MDATAARGLEIGMSKMGWRLRVFARRAVPHTPAKRWAYGAMLLLIVVVLALGHPAFAAGGLALLVVLRIADLRRTRARRGHMPTSRAYFFEGEEDARR